MAFLGTVVSHAGDGQAGKLVNVTAALVTGLKLPFILFVIGLACAAAVSMGSYLAQTCYQHGTDGGFSPEKRKMLTKAGEILRWFCVTLALASLTLFIVGAIFSASEMTSTISSGLKS
jgi:hypothetical protein